MVECIAAAPASYISVLKVVVMLVLLVPWLYAAPFVYRDAVRVRISKVTWSVVVLTSGSVGLIAWMLAPLYFVGLLVYVVLTAASLLVYAVYRDGKADAEDKLLSGRFFQSIFLRSPLKEVDVVTRLKVYDYIPRIVDPPNPQTSPASECEAYNLMQAFLYDIVFRRGSEVDISPGPETSRVRLLVDGVIVDRPALPLADSEAIIQYLKRIGGMDTEDRRRPQQGRISVDVAGGVAADVELTTAGTTGGQRLQLRIVQETVKTDLEELGLSDDLLTRLRAMGKFDTGLIVVSGRPHGGLTSTLYALLREQDAFIKQLVTLEASPVVDLENVTQVAYGEEAKLPEALGGVIRRDPDVIMVDRCPEEKTADLVNRAADSKLVLLGLHALDAFSGLARWVQVCNDAAGAVKNLRGVLCQVLLRKLCPNCREPYRPDPNVVAKANLSGEKIENFYRPPTRELLDDKGNPITCQACQGTGYVGRTGAFELLEVTDDVRQLVADGATLVEIKAACRKSKMLYIQEQALRKVIQSITSVQEVIRVTKAPKKKTS